MVFTPPNLSERLAAIGKLENLSEVDIRAFNPDLDFETIPIPKKGDWLSEYPEKGQKFHEYIKSKWKKPNHQKHKIYLLPLGEFSEDKSPSVETLRKYAMVFFSMDVCIFSPLLLEDIHFTTRINPYTLKRQILTTDIMQILRKRFPYDAFCVLAITMEDLFPKPSWNFCFGQASLIHRVGVFSFVRYDPVFYGELRDENYQKVLLWRSCKVLTHETAHMFGLSHCIYFKCAMNGSNHLVESDSRPMQLCPVCLRKLHYAIQFDILERYKQLLRFYQKETFEKESQWIKNRLKNVYKSSN